MTPQRKMADTSLSAYHRVMPKLGMRQREVYAVLHDATEHGVCLGLHDVAQLLDRPVNALSGRFTELRKQGLIVRVRKEINDAGFACWTYQVVKQK